MDTLFQGHLFGSPYRFPIVHRSKNPQAPGHIVFLLSLGEEVAIWIQAGCSLQEMGPCRHY